MYYPLVLTIFVVCSLYWWYWTRSRRSIAQLPGPSPDSWLVGSIPKFQRAENAADADFNWTKKYGTTFRFKGCFGEDVLYVADPKALQYILNKSGYGFLKTWEARVRSRLATGHGILAVDGAHHARHRRVMNPSFSHSALKGFLPLFNDIAQRTTNAWRVLIRQQNTETSVIDVSSLLARTTLDAIGEAAFGYKFNSIEGAEPKTELHKAYHNLFVDVNYMPSNFSIVFRRLLGYAPIWLSDILTLLPTKEMLRLNSYMAVARNVAGGIVEQQLYAQKSGKEGGKDVMSILVKANHAEDPKRRLDEDEIISQITTLLLAGHETTANSLGWTLFELSKHPEVQRKLRDEVKATLFDVASRGEGITIADLDSMKYTTAVMKEILRYHPIVPQIFRRAAHDDIIPLGAPQKTISGEVITAIPVRKGQVVQVGFASYNRLKEVWGDDADEWKPERFLEENPAGRKTNLGVTGNLSTFSSGLRSCIGWRFALLEMQAVLVDLIDNFDFSPAPNVEIKRAVNGLMQSMVKGQEGEGTQLPLTVSILPQGHTD